MPVSSAVRARRLPVGAEVLDGGAHFRVWAPKSKQVGVRLAGEDSRASELEAEGGGYFSGSVTEARVGADYQLQLDHGLFPDPASRFQPQGPHEASRIVDPGGFQWSDEKWRGVGIDGHVIYEMHIGTFTREGTWRAAAEQLEELAELGITLIEMMPVADFPGRYGWGYDGVNLFAPTRLYGEPDDLRHFVDRAHALGLGVILDVVYNHLGPDGNYLPEFSADYFSQHYHSEWGEALNFDGDHSGPVREFYLANAAYWIDEFHFDGLRIDATQQIFDASPDHILAAVARTVRAAAKGRGTYLVGENEPQHSRLVRAVERGGHGLDALWNDDFHHSAIVALTGRHEAYYSDYRGGAQEFISAAKWGYLYQGQRYTWQKARRGTPSLDLRAANFVTFVENHDQVANSLWGRRLFDLGNEARARALTALLLLGPDAACRPNQVFSISLRHPVLDESHWAAVIEKVRAELLTPVGLRSLSRGHPDYKARYFGDLRARDAAYHQGTVWGWLIGPCIDAWLKVHPEDRTGARQWLWGLLAHLNDAAVGSMSEIFDAEEPFTPRGCIAQAWSVAEVLRCWVKTAE